MSCPKCGYPMPESGFVCAGCGHKQIPQYFKNTLGGISVFFLTRYYPFFFLPVLFIGAVVYLIMSKGLKMKKPERTICLLIYMQTFYLLLCNVVTMAAAPYLTQVLSLPDSIFFHSTLHFILNCVELLVVLIIAGLFYGFKSRVCAVVLIVVEFLSLMNGVRNVVSLMSYTTNQIELALIQIIWRGVIVFLLTRWLIRRKKGHRTPLPSGNTQKR